MKDRPKKIKPCNGNCGCGGGTPGDDTAKAAINTAGQADAVTEATYSFSTLMAAFYIGQDVGHIEAAREERMSSLNTLLGEKAL